MNGLLDSTSPDPFFGHPSRHFLLKLAYLRARGITDLIQSGV
jgi:hypothetical protein